MITRICFFLLIFAIPFQLGLHFWPPTSFVAGFKIDYYSPTIYLFDLLLVLNLFLNHRLIISKAKKLKKNQIVLFVSLMSFNLYRSDLAIPTLTFWVRVLELISFVFLLLGTKDLKAQVKKPFIVSLVLTCFLSISQFVLQHSLQGPFYYLGERSFDSSTPNLAHANLLGFRLIRPYATFSHPNSLAGYLLVSILILSLFASSKWLKRVVLGTILLTTSRTALLAYLLVFLIRPPRFYLIAIFLLLSSLPFYYHFLPVSLFDKEISSRLALLLTTLKLSSFDWLFGLGLNQYICRLPSLLPASGISQATLQPIHNTLLLLLAELGLLPLLILLPKFKILLDTKYYLLTSIVLLTSSLDHYWVTLPQNRLVLTLAMVLLFRYGSKRNSHPHRRRFAR